MTYAEKLRDPRWQKKRLMVLERAGWKCQCCDDGTQTLQVHHLIYSPGEPWDAPLETLECLCEDCHQWRTDFDAFFDRGMAPTKVCVEFHSAYQIAFKHWDKGFRRGHFTNTETLSSHISGYLRSYRLKREASSVGV